MNRQNEIPLPNKIKLIMNHPLNFIKPSLVLALGLAFSACGGGGGSQFAEGGITGTGITMGRITSFGSIYVNGVQFDVNNASFSRDGQSSAGQSEFRIGEYVVINGSISGATGIASSVSFDDVIEGEVTTSSADGKTLSVLGQSVSTDQLTLFYGFAALTDLIVGNVVEISGVSNASGTLVATSIRKVSETFQPSVSENSVKGTISNLNTTAKTFSINGLTVEYGTASLVNIVGQDPSNGQLVEVSSNSALVGNNLNAVEVKAINNTISLGSGSEVEVEGFVTSFTSSSVFEVNGIPVQTTQSTSFENGASSDIALNVFIEVEGAVNSSGTLIAEEVEFEDNENANELDGVIQSIDLASGEIEVANQIVIIDANTLMKDDSSQGDIPITINDLVVGDTVEIKGIALSNGKIRATRLERENNND